MTNWDPFTTLPFTFWVVRLPFCSQNTVKSATLAFDKISEGIPITYAPGNRLASERPINGSLQIAHVLNSGQKIPCPDGLRLFKN